LIDLAKAIAHAFRAAREHAALVRDIDEAKHIATCEQFEASVRSVFTDASAADEALRSFERFDANGRAKVYSLSVKRDFYSSSTLHFRIDASNTAVWWQLRDAPACWEFAAWGWFVVPVLTVPTSTLTCTRRS
jgi:hypothetical protein